MAQGERAVYPRTGTTGRIARIVELNGKTWAELDTTGLLYEINTLEAVTEAKKGREEKKAPERRKRRKGKVGVLEDMKDEGTLDSSANIGGAG